MKTSSWVDCGTPFVFSRSMKRVKPSLPSGVREYSTSESIRRQAMLDKIRSSFEVYGFDPLETPCLERREVLGNDDGHSLVYGASLPGQEDSSDPMALRFDLTVPLARHVTANMKDLKFPFRRYQIGHVWRGERPQAGRYREFLQADADIVGSSSLDSDAEIISLAAHTLDNLGVQRFSIFINNRKILDGLPEFAGFDPSLTTDVLRVIDKMFKIGHEAVMRELQRPRLLDSSVPQVGDDQRESRSGLGLSESTVQKIQKFIFAGSGGREAGKDVLENLNVLSEIMAGIAIAQEGIEELRHVYEAIEYQHRQEVRFDQTIARGLGYYTGMVFETFIGAERVGSVASGGRYDCLVNRFTQNPIAATGFSIGVDRLFSVNPAKEHTDYRTNVKAMVISTSDEWDCEARAILFILRRDGIPSFMWTEANATVKRGLEHAVKRGIPFIVFVGDETKDQMVAVKHTPTNRQAVIPRRMLSKYIEEMTRQGC